VVDEAFYYAEGAPKVLGAEVIVRDAISAEEIGRQTTPITGRVTFPELLEGWYAVEIVSGSHARWKGNIQVSASENNFKQVFVSRETVKYTWTVEEIEINDRYRITVESTFETNVPAPVVTVSPAVLDVEDLTVLGQTKVINFVIENHGWIAANHSNFSFDSHPFYKVTPLIEDIGTIPAKSSLVVPVHVQLIGRFTESGGVEYLAAGARESGPMALKSEIAPSSAPASGDVPCGFRGRIKWDYICGIFPVPKSVEVMVSGASGDCRGGWHPRGGSGPGGTTVRPTSHPVSYASSETSCLELCLAKSTFDCIAGFVPIVQCFWAGANCVLSLGQENPFEWIWSCGTAPLCVAKPIVNTGLCIANWAKCYADNSDGGGTPNPFPEITNALSGRSMQANTAAIEIGQPWLKIMDQTTRDFEPQTAAAWSRVETHLDFMAVMLGSRERVLRRNDEQVEAWYEDLRLRMTPASESNQIVSLTEKMALEAAALAKGLDFSEFEPIIDRFNRTLDYASRGILELNQVPSGESLDFIPWSQVQDAAIAVQVAHLQSQAAGFANPGAELEARFNEAKSSMQNRQGGVCSQVKIRIDQEAVMTRSAFRATLELANNLPNTALSDVGFTVQVKDSSGGVADDKFNVQVTKLSGLSAIDGTGSIPALSTGGAQWTLIPRDTAAPTADTVYTIGGTISYKQSGTLFSIPVVPVEITVRPDAALHLKYFHQRDVVSDDPHTEVIEPFIPYHLAVMVENKGAGAARNLTITSAQPEIVENEKGLLIDFNIIGTQVAGQARSPSLKADFGNVQPNERKVATWDITSSLQGLFIDYKATFQHLDGFGDERLSLIKDVQIHEMIHMVEAQGTLADGLPDFLVNDVSDIDDLPDTIHLSDGTTAPVSVVSVGTPSGAVSGGSLTITLSTAQGAGWSYLRIPDPANGAYKLASVQRSDGASIPVEKNVWVTDRTFIGLGRRPIYENILHLVDRNSTGQYTLTYAVIAPDTEPPNSSVQPLPAQSTPFIPVRWSGTDNRGLATFDIFVSENGGSFVPWMTGTTKLSSIYFGETGKNYAFYSRARDTANNVEAAPAAPDASTAVSLQNAAPVLTNIGNLSINEHETLQISASATDDGPADQLHFTLSSSHPGLSIDEATGAVSWTTQETDGGRTFDVTITVNDAGVPILSDSETFTVSVLETNEAPVFQTVAAVAVNAGDTLQTTLRATDADFPAQTLTYSLSAGAPVGMMIDPATGVLTWSVPEAFGESSVQVEVLVADNGSVPKQSSVQLLVQVTGEIIDDNELPVVTTSIPADLASTSAHAGGEVVDQQGSAVTERGVVYSTVPEPTTLDALSQNMRAGEGDGVFEAWLVGLQPGTTYYLRAYAINASGTAYGEQVTFTTAPAEPGARRVLYLKAGNPGTWSVAGTAASRSGEVSRWLDAGYEVALGDANVVHLSAGVLAQYEVLRLFARLDQGDYPDAQGAAIHAWVTAGGAAIIEAAETRSLSSVRRFGVERINGRHGGISGTEWHYQGAPLFTSRIAAPLGPIAKLAASHMDRPVMARGTKLKVVAKVSGQPAIAQGSFGLGRAVVHFLEDWSGDDLLPLTENTAYLNKLMDFSGRPTRWDPQVLPVAMVGQPLDFDLTGAGWTILSVSGLPPGVKFVSGTGRLMGQPLRTGAYSIRVRILEASGVVSDIRFILRVAPLPQSAQGSFVALVDRNGALNQDLGGRLTFRVASTGSVSGKLALGAKTHAFTGRVIADGTAVVRVPLTVKRAGLPSVELDLICSTQHLVSGGAILSGEATSVPVTGWRRVWLATSPATRYAGAYTAGLDLQPVDLMQQHIPQGTGYLAMSVTGKTGAVTLSGRLADGSAVSRTTFVGPTGQTDAYQPLYSAAFQGSLLGQVQIQPAQRPADTTLTGTLSWWHPENNPTANRLYPAAFGPLNLTVQGGRHLIPTGNALVMNLDPSQSSNARLVFTSPEGDEISPRPPPDLVFTIGSKHRIILPTATLNPRKTTFTVSPKTGLFSGGFTMIDSHPFVADKKVTRPGTYRGAIIRTSAGLLRGYGYYHLPELPITADQSTSATPMKSGQVVLEPHP